MSMYGIDPEETADALDARAEFGAADLMREMATRITTLETTLATTQALHKPRTERHGAGCVQCGILWPCPTYKALATPEEA